MQTLCESERVLRTPEKIRDNVWNALTSNLDESTLKSMGLIVEGHFDSFAQHESTARIITGMPLDESPFFIIDRSTNGKSGIMVTTRSLRVYEKGLLSYENKEYDIRKIRSFECVGHGQFVFTVNDAEPIEVRLSAYNVADEQQIRFASAVEQAILIINRLAPKNFQNLYRILYGKATCICGTKLLPAERVCPVCGKLVKANGEIVDVTYCPKCGFPQQRGKKICTSCGNPLVSRQESATPVTTANDGRMPCLEQNAEANDCVANTNSKHEENTAKENDGAEQFCPACGKPIKIGKKFCPSCGNKL